MLQRGKSIDKASDAGHPVVESGAMRGYEG